MSNHHLRNHELSLKAKGLLSMMLSLPDDWNYTTRGLAKICKEGVDAIGQCAAGVGNRRLHRAEPAAGPTSRISDTEYVIYEKPQPRQPETPRPDTAVPDTASPDTENPYLDKPDTEKARRIKYRETKYSKTKYSWSKYRFHSLPGNSGSTAAGTERKGCDVCLRDRKISGIDSGEHRV